MRHGSEAESSIRRRHLSRDASRDGADLVEGDTYLLKLTRYVHLNPVCIKSVIRLPIEHRRQRLRSYRWSTFRGYTGEDKPLDFVDYGPVLAQMMAKKGKRHQEYRKFVETGLAKSDEEFAVQLKWLKHGAVKRRDVKRMVEGTERRLSKMLGSLPSFEF